MIVAANLMAMLIQTLSAKLGIATRRNLPEVCREQFSRRTSFLLWVQAEAIAMATDLAEFLGAAIGFHLLLGIGLLFPPRCSTGIAAFAILGLQRFGFRPLEAVIADARRRDRRLLPRRARSRAPRLRPGRSSTRSCPQFGGSEAVLLSVGILGATVMPHVIYLHSALTQDRIVPENDADAQTLLRYTRIDVVIAMSIAGLINVSMLVMAASTFFKTRPARTSTRSRARTRRSSRSSAAPRARCSRSRCSRSGLSSSAVGTLSGQVVMQGFIRRQIPLRVRRLVTMVPAFVVIAIGVDPSRTLVLSQVVLSFGIPFALIPLVYFTSRRDMMGAARQPPRSRPSPRRRRRA